MMSSETEKFEKKWYLSLIIIELFWKHSPVLRGAGDLSRWDIYLLFSERGDIMLAEWTQTHLTGGSFPSKTGGLAFSDSRNLLECESKTELHQILYKILNRITSFSLLPLKDLFQSTDYRLHKYSLSYIDYV